MGEEQEPKRYTGQGVEEEAWLRVMEVATLSCLPMAIKAAINLNVMTILASEPSLHLSAPQIVARMHTHHPKPPPSPSLLDRILRLLASHGILASSLQTTPSLALDTPPSLPPSPLEPTRAYGLNSISHYFVPPPHESSASLSPFLLMHQDRVFIESLLYIDDALRDGGEPFTLAHGKNNFLYNQEDARFDKIFNLAMHNHSRLLVSSLVDTYDGFADLHSLVDVGGGLGVTLGIITSKNPHIHGINFDLPHIVAKAPHYNGVEHVGGDMFVSIPKADAIFMKWILHDWSDDQCKKILQNCYQALPRKGKVIVVDVVLPTEVDPKLKTRVGYHLDLLMFAYNGGGRERSFIELKALALSAGFSDLKVICEVQELTVVEMYKS